MSFLAHPESSSALSWPDKVRQCICSVTSYPILHNLFICKIRVPVVCPDSVPVVSEHHGVGLKVRIKLPLIGNVRIDCLKEAPIPSQPHGNDDGNGITHLHLNNFCSC